MTALWGRKVADLGFRQFVQILHATARKTGAEVHHIDRTTQTAPNSRASVGALSGTLYQFTAAFNHVCTYGWAHAEKNGVQLHHATYYATKALCPGLVSDLVIQARVKATEALKSAFARQKAGRPVSCPCSTQCPPRYNVHTYTLSWDTQTARLSTVAGRMSVPFTVPAYAAKFVGLPVDTADLLTRPDGGWWLHVVVTIDAPQGVPTEEVVGIDLGLTQPAVTSTNQFLGKKAWKATEGRYFRLKRAVQTRGTKRAKRHLRHLRHTQARFRRNCDHVLSKQLVHTVAPGGTLVLENLTDIRRRAKAKCRTQAKRRLHSWSFARLRTFLTYKAEERGCTVVAVDPRHTSQTCSRCGHQARNKRDNRMRELFHERRHGRLWRRTRRREHPGHPDGPAIRQDTLRALGTHCRERLGQDHASPSFLRLRRQRARHRALPF